MKVDLYCVNAQLAGVLDNAVFFQLKPGSH